MYLSLRFQISGDFLGQGEEEGNFRIAFMVFLSSKSWENFKVNKDEYKCRSIADLLVGLLGNSHNLDGG